MIKDYINRSFLVGNIIVFKIVPKNMAYYIYINSGNNALASIDQFPTYFSSFPSFYQPTQDFVGPSFYTLPWNQTEFVQPIQSYPTFINTVTSENGPIINQISPISVEKPLKKAQKSLEKQLLSARKNSQSNIINHFYSFFGNREKSQKIVRHCLVLMGKTRNQFEKIFSFFYMAMKLIATKRGRKYVNVATFLRFFDPQELANHLPEMVQKLDKSPVLSIQQLCQMIRRCGKHFLKNISANAILTSKRISIVSKEEHLRKRRKFLRAMQHEI